MPGTNGFFARNYLGFVLLISLILGGGTDQMLWSDHLLQILMLPLMITGFSKAGSNKISKTAQIIAAMAVLLIIVQFLPFNMGNNFPKTSDIPTAYNFWSNSIHRSLQSAIYFLPVLGLVFYIANLDDTELIGLLRFIFLGFLINLIVAIIWLSYSGRVSTDSILPFTITSALFANENHFATLCSMMLPILGWRFLVLKPQPIVFILYSLIVTGILFAVGSRAGMAFASVISILCLIWYITRNLPLRKKLIGVIGALLLIGISSSIFGFHELWADEKRTTFFATTWIAIKDHWLTGTGLGTFVQVYPIYEKTTDIFNKFVNHAHSDYLELLLELGVLVVVPIILFYARVLKALVTNPVDGILSLSLLIVLIHSAVDYPLRTYAVAILFSFATAIIFRRRSKPLL